MKCFRLYGVICQISHFFFFFLFHTSKVCSASASFNGPLFDLTIKLLSSAAIIGPFGGKDDSQIQINNIYF